MADASVPSEGNFTKKVGRKERHAPGVFLTIIRRMNCQRQDLKWRTVEFEFHLLTSIKTNALDSFAYSMAVEELYRL